MFAKLFNTVALLTAIAGVVAIPMPKPQVIAKPVELAARGGSYSFNNWGGISSLSGFDNFYGSSNFNGEVSKQVIIKQEKEVVCRSQSIEIIQQRLLVLQEMAKRIITEQICEVETQTIVFEQFRSSISSFGSDLGRRSSRNVGYDSSIAGHFNGIVGSDGSLSSNDLGFNGQQNGLNTVVPQGNNWNSNSSPASVGAAFNATRVASGRNNKSSASSNSTSTPSSATAAPASSAPAPASSASASNSTSAH